MAAHADKHQSRIIEFMHRPDFYPHPVRSVILRETHISMVFLTGDYVYKIKKPVDMGFLDFTTLEKRRQYCRRELELNRRLSRNIYLAVVPVTFKQNRYGKLLLLAQEEIEKENSVILDATFSRKNQRRQALRLAEGTDANIVFLECVCSETVLKDRLKKRNTVPTLSDARPEHFENLKAVFEPTDDLSQSIHLAVDTQKSADDSIREILARQDLPIPG